MVVAYAIRKDNLFAEHTRIALECEREFEEILDFTCRRNVLYVGRLNSLKKSAVPRFTVAGT